MKSRTDRFLLTALCCAAFLPAWAGAQSIPDCTEHDLPPLRLSCNARVEIVFALDTTGSMSGLIEGAKQKIWGIVNAISRARPEPEIRLGLLVYRDQGDEYVTRIEPLTADIDAVYAALMESEAAGGGDTPESVNQALHEAVNLFAWSGGAGTLRIVYLVGDAPPHMSYQADVQYPASCALAREKGILINAIQCGSIKGTADVWQEIARLAGGNYFRIEQSGGMRARTTPYDRQLALHCLRLDETAVPYGGAEAMAEHEARLERSRRIDKHAPAEALADRAAFKGRAGAGPLAGEHELVAALAEGRIDLDSLPRELLPERLREMTREQLERHLWHQSEQRRGLREEIAWLTRRREEHIAETYGADGQSFDDRVLQSFRCQARRKGIHLEVR